jgi:hypothetical protein
MTTDGSNDRIISLLLKKSNNILFDGFGWIREVSNKSNLLLILILFGEIIKGGEDSFSSSLNRINRSSDILDIVNFWRIGLQINLIPIESHGLIAILQCLLVLLETLISGNLSSKESITGHDTKCIHGFSEEISEVIIIFEWFSSHLVDSFGEIEHSSWSLQLNECSLIEFIITHLLKQFKRGTQILILLHALLISTNTWSNHSIINLLNGLLQQIRLQHIIVHITL